jgi:hypothetical protein
LLVAAALVFAPAAASAAITVFDVTGTAQNVSGVALGTCASNATCNFSGTLGMDVALGALLTVDITFPGLSGPFNTLGPQNSAPPNGWTFTAGNGFDDLTLDFTTTPTPGSLVGFAGGTITGLQVDERVTMNGTLLLYTVQSGGSITAVPEPATWAMMLLGFAGLGFAFRRSRRKAAFA